MGGAKYFAIIGCLMIIGGGFLAFFGAGFGALTSITGLTLFFSGMPIAALGSFLLFVASKLEVIAVQERNQTALMKVIAYNSGPMKEILRHNPDYFTEQQKEFLETVFEGLRTERHPPIELSK